MVKEKKIEWIVGLVFAIVGGIFIIVGISTYLLGNNLQGDTKQTEAIVYEVDRYRDSYGDYQYRIWVEYEIGGIQYREELPYYSSDMQEGKKIKIYYDKDNPGQIMIGQEIMFPMMLAFVGMGSFFFILGMCVIVNKVKGTSMNKKLKEVGERIEADYMDTTYNTSYIVNGKSPYYITCKWEDSMDGKTYLFKSGNIWYDPSEFIQEREIKTFPVYRDPGNKKKYVVDISMLEDKIVDLR